MILSERFRSGKTNSYLKLLHKWMISRLYSMTKKLENHIIFYMFFGVIIINTFFK